MKDKSNISIVISIIALSVSLFAIIIVLNVSLSFSFFDLFGKSDSYRFDRDNDKVYIPADPKAKKELNDFENLLEKSPLTPNNVDLDKTPKTSIKFNKDSHDFGNIEQDTENKYSFTFTNTGNEPLKIKNAKGSCGCTVPNYPKEPIMPGKTGQIDVVYKPAKQKGNQNKNVTVSANTNPENTILRISANVNSPDE